MYFFSHIFSELNLEAAGLLKDALAPGRIIWAFSSVDGVETISMESFSAAFYIVDSWKQTVSQRTLLRY